MDDLRQRFAALDRMPVPDLWADVERRLVAVPQTAAGSRGITVRVGRRGGPQPRSLGWSLGMLVAATVLALLIGAAFAVGSGLLRLPALLPAGPVQTPFQAPSPTAQATNSPAAWTSGGDMPDVFGPVLSAGPLRDGTVLVVALNTHAGARFDPRDGTWTSTSAPSRGDATLTVLADGTVLAIAGGPAGIGAQLYDPVTAEWNSAADMLVGCPSFGEGASESCGVTATLLKDGRVLVVGGEAPPFESRKPLATAELFDPTTSTWTMTGALHEPRDHHTATLLNDGRVLVVGGAVYKDGDLVSELDSAELYDPSSGTWSYTGSLALARAFHSATLLADGNVIVTGNAADTTSTERFDPDTGQWLPSGAMAAPRYGATTTLLADDNVLLAGGRTPAEHLGKPTASTELYDALTGEWRPTAPMSVGRSFHAAVLLPDGRVLVAGGEMDFLSMNWLRSSELYDPGDLSIR